MSFLTSFCDFPQKLQLRVSRFSKPGLLDGGTSAPLHFSSLLRLLLRRLLVGEDLVDQPVLLCLTWAHEVVTIGVLLDPLDGLPGVLGQDVVEAGLQTERLLGLDLDVGGLPLIPA